MRLLKWIKVHLDPEPLAICPCCEGDGELDYLGTGHMFSCGWCGNSPHGPGIVSRQDAEDYIGMMQAIHGPLWQPWFGRRFG